MAFEIGSRFGAVTVGEKYRSMWQSQLSMKEGFGKAFKEKSQSTSSLPKG